MGERHERERYYLHGPVADPPFFTVSLSRLFTAVRVLARSDF